MNDEREEAERKGDYDTPRPLDNRAGLDTLRYRVGTFDSFRRTMLRNIPRVQVEADGRTIKAPLRSWSARDSDDYGIALIELWAYVADILTFYQERIANEAFIRTARHRDSLIYLANLLDYKAAPGVASSVYLVFQMKDGTSARIRRQFPVQHVPAGEEKPQTFETSDELDARDVWNELTPLPDPAKNVTFHIDDTTTRLKGARARIAVGDWVLIVGEKRAGLDPDSEQYEVRRVIAVERDTEAGETRIVFNEKLGTRVWGNEIVVEEEADLYVFRGRGALFGHNAPDWRTLGPLAAYEYLPPEEQDVDTTLDPGPYLMAVTAKVREQKDFPNQELGLGKHTLDLDRVHESVVKGGWIVMGNSGYREAYKVTNVETVSRTDYTRTAQVSRLQVDTDENFDNYGLADDAPFSRVRGTEVLLDAEQLPLAQDVSPTPVSGMEIDVREDIRSLRQGHLLMVFGETESNGIQGEVAAVKETQSLSGGTPGSRIILAEGLKYSYVRVNTRIFANVVPATHGETIADEILGNGDASIPFQRFELKQSPLTHVPQAGAPNGAAPALELRVNGVLWKKVPSFYGRAPDETVYTIDITDEQETIIRTGDSHTGARPGTGPNTVSATYRKGLGKVGNVPAKSIKTPLERPKGLWKVFNPTASSGGAEPEALDAVRVNAPNTVRTFGRIVSLRDFEDAAREFIGISKARAFIEWDQEWQVVKLVIAGDGGTEVVGETFRTFVDDLDGRRDPNRKLSVVNYTPVDAALTLQIYPDPAYLSDAVLANVTAAVEQFFAFDRLSLGQAIALSEIYQVVHSAEGVIGADITRFHLLDAPEAVEDVLRIGRDQLVRLETGASSTYAVDIAEEA
ncbi:baseplate J/gp47 family protein [Desulfococcus multivorans]|uniref:Baseplate J family protein n=1 Tax=Desulfococcus multivorans DSM 2059 TaxID=1121405 RepID=S7U0U0_DESML|nr:baseplate J/gp47 family protein [Desulfococcus multivorans]AOY59397.1 conserved uncharacterized protein [Desulfococcus multivorans]AQV01608.1 hypothetical protein B2D07_13130 [Desulfococcus multivorans]EPR43051.1 Baseplate J family protein [Desulfococcus multivorans DSM 2059]SJZ99941.1 putative baseplate assembly protein [Desulfococcus multivorans DSM 2059]